MTPPVAGRPPILALRGVDKAFGAKHVLRGLGLDEIAIAGIMTREVHCCRPGDSIQTAERVLGDARVHRVPVVDAEGRLVGILSVTDLVRHVHGNGRLPIDGLSTSSVARTIAAIQEPLPRNPTAR